MNIQKITNPIAYENTYFLTNDTATLIIDPGNDSDKILAVIREIGKPVAAILLTHTHYDHIMGVEAVRAETGAPVYVSALEADWLYTPVLNLSGLPHHKDDLPDVMVNAAEHTFETGKTYDLSGFVFTVLATPGHSQGGVSFVFETEHKVFTGDALFSGTIGRTDLNTGDVEILKNSIITQLFPLDNDYQVFPGHGPQTTIGAEKHFNPFFQ
ncbi:MBL fold metallo-hydrolase [Pseudolactococcus insecticola]|uniref:Hydrolase n=1 Tax=Pseudolactococcus insecticola TaxID=2709158 RepID=A0A6A0B681_9LACT|nr:MBL fold metallo-hydrolase [Lactococcus insecticola]GFH40742.1 hydrolase [Lactococcus insecticola]